MGSCRVLCLRVSVKSFIHDLDDVSVGNSTGNRPQSQAGKSETHLIKGLLGRAIRGLIRDSAESQHWPNSLPGKISSWN